jgi:hypothetical protein
LGFAVIGCANMVAMVFARICLLSDWYESMRRFWASGDERM